MVPRVPRIPNIDDKASIVAKLDIYEISNRSDPTECESWGTFIDDNIMNNFCEDL